MVKLYEDFIADTEETFTMYHGTDEAHENILLRDGFIPNRCKSGSQCGDPSFLYLTMSPESAGWYACMKGNEKTILEVTGIPKSYLGVDPEDGMYYYPEYNLDKELENDGSFVLKKPLDSSHFSHYKGKLTITGCDN